MSNVIEESLASKSLLIMDGGFGTELPKRGIETSLPSWSGAAARSREGRIASRLIHEASLEIGGVDMLIAGSFRTQPYVYRKEGLPDITARLATLAACRTAREARATSGRHDVLIAGSNGPLEDCYSPEDTPSKRELDRGHRAHAENLAIAQDRGDIDFYLPETIITLRETEAVLRAGQLAGLSTMGVSFCCSEDGRSLLSGESLSQAVKLADQYNVAFTGINCVKASVATRGLGYLAEMKTDIPLAVYAQGGEDTSHDHRDSVDGPYDEYLAEQAERWYDLGARIIGGCCGVSPQNIQKIAHRLSGFRTQNDNDLVSRQLLS